MSLPAAPPPRPPWWLCQAEIPRRAADYVPVQANVLISNVRAPAGDHYLGTVPVVANYPVSMVGDGMGLNMTVHGFHDRLDSGFIADPEMMPDVWELVEHLQTSHQELLDTLPS